MTGGRGRPPGPPTRSRALRRLVPVAWRRRLAVLVGGAVGTGLRMAVGLVADGAAGWPWATLTANLTGAAALGYLLTRLQQAGSTTTLTVPLLCTGVLGSYTTFSAFAVETRGLVVEGRPGAAAGYLAASLVGGYLAAAAGVRGARARA